MFRSALLIAAGLCAGCATTSPPVGDTHTAMASPGVEGAPGGETAAQQEEFQPDTIIVHKITVEDDTPRKTKSRCDFKPPVGSRIKRMRCVSGSQRDKEQAAAQRVLERADGRGF